MIKPQDTNRLAYLDSMRGWAAFTVVIFHTNVWLDFSKDTHFNSSWPTHVLNIFFNGHNAVAFFFVLSGFVLAYKYAQNRKRTFSYAEFMTKRAFRIYPAFWLVLILTALYTGFDFEDFFRQMLLLEKGFHKLIPPAWSLAIEMRYSLIFPFLLIIAFRNLKLLFVLCGLLFLLFDFDIFVVHFCLGITLALNYEKIIKIKLSKGQRYLLFLLGLFLCSYEQIHFLIIPHEDFKATKTQTGFFLGALGCAIWMVLAMSAPKFQKRISLKPLLKLGDISYGLYVGHRLILVNIMEPHFEKAVSFFGSFYIAHALYRVTLAVTLSLLFAFLLYEFVEKPFIKMGRKVSGQVKDKLLLSTR